MSNKLEPLPSLPFKAGHFFKSFLIKVQLIYNFILVSGIQHSNSVFYRLNSQYYCTVYWYVYLHVLSYILSHICRDPTAGSLGILAPHYISVSPAVVVVVHAQSCPTLCDPMDCSPLGSSVLGISPAKILEWVAISSSRTNNCFEDKSTC